MTSKITRSQPEQLAVETQEPARPCPDQACWAPVAGAPARRPRPIVSEEEEAPRAAPAPAPASMVQPRDRKKKLNPGRARRGVSPPQMHRPKGLLIQKLVIQMQTESF